MLNIHLSQNIELKAKLEALVDALIDLIVRFNDYSILRHITLAEATLFLLAALRAIWFILFGVENANYDYVLSDRIWTVLFSSSALLHFVGFFFKHLKIRIWSIYLYSFMWSFLMVLAVYSRTTAPDPPALAVLTGLSLIVIVRLKREKVDVDK